MSVPSATAIRPRFRTRAAIWLDESVTATATAAALAAVAVQVGWFWRSEAGAATAVGACAGLGLLALASPAAQFTDAARLAGFASLALSVPSALLLLATPPIGDGIERLAGVDAVATSVAVSEEVFPLADLAVVAVASEPRHALVAASLAAVRDAPLLLTPSDELRSDVLSEIARLRVARVVIVAETASSGMERELTRMGVESDRVGGTAVEAAAAIARARPPSPWLVTDGIGPDGRVRPSIPEAIVRGTPIVLADRQHIPLVTAGALRDARPVELVVGVESHPDIGPMLHEVVGAVSVSRGFGAAAIDRTGRWVAAAGSPIDVAVAAAAAAATEGDVVLVRAGERPIVSGAGSIVIVGGTGAVPTDFVGDERS